MKLINEVRSEFGYCAKIYEQKNESYVVDFFKPSGEMIRSQYFNKNSYSKHYVTEYVNAWINTVRVLSE